MEMEFKDDSRRRKVFVALGSCSASWPAGRRST